MSEDNESVNAYARCGPQYQVDENEISSVVKPNFHSNTSLESNRIHQSCMDFEVDSFLFQVDKLQKESLRVGDIVQYCNMVCCIVKQQSDSDILTVYNGECESNVRYLKLVLCAYIC